VQKIKRKLLEYRYKGGDELDAGLLQATLESAIIEIARLQRELDEAKKPKKKQEETEKK
jgi:hypothetical protein